MMDAARRPNTKLIRGRSTVTPHRWRDDLPVCGAAAGHAISSCLPPPSPSHLSFPTTPFSYFLAPLTPFLRPSLPPLRNLADGEALWWCLRSSCVASPLTWPFPMASAVLSCVPVFSFDIWQCRPSVSVRLKVAREDRS